MELLRHVEWLRRLAGRLVIDAALADDVAQQTLLMALRAPPADARRPRAWLGTVARHIAATLGRQRRRSLQRETLAARDVREPSSHDVVAQAALHHALVGAVLALDEPYRTALLRHWFDGEKPGAIAREQGVSVETVRTRLKRGLELLRRELVTRRRLPDGIVALVALLGTGARAATAKAIAAGAVAAAAGGMGAGAFGGVIAMAAKAKAGWIAAVLLVAAIAAWQAIVPWRSSVGDRAAIDSAAAADAALDVDETGATAGVAVREASHAAATAASVPRALFRGVVLTEAGDPISGARVGVPQPTAEFALAEPTVVTDANGRFELPLEGDVDENAMRRDVAALAPGWLPAVWRRATPGDELVLVLPRGVSVSGRVRDLDGRPVAGAGVCWRFEGARRLVAHATSAADGTFRMGSVVAFRSSEPGDQGLPWLDVRADGFATLTLMAHGVVRAIDRHTLECELWLTRGATARGRVVDLATGAPIAGADVWLEPWDDDVPTTLHTTSARDGTFTLAGLPAWGVTLAGLHGPNPSRRRLGELCAQAPHRGRARFELELPDEGALLDVTLPLPRVAGVRGRVVDESGRPVASVAIFASGSAAQQRHDPAAVHEHASAPPMTDGDGRYELTGLAVAEGSASAVRVDGRLDDGDVTVAQTDAREVVLSEGAVAEAPDLVLRSFPWWLIDVTDRDGVPVARAVVALGAVVEGIPRFIDGVTTNRNGRAFVAPEQLEAWQASDSRAAPCVLVAADGFATTNVPFAPDAKRRMHVQLEPEHRLVGRIVDRDGAAGGGFVVALPASSMAAEPFAAAIRDDRFWLMAEAQQSARADVAVGVGRFVLRGLSAGPWHVAVVRPAGAALLGSRVELTGPHEEGREAVLVIDGSARVDASLRAGVADDAAGAQPPTGSVEITLAYAANGKPVLRAGSVTLRAGELWHDALPVAPGVFLFERVPPGAWTVVVDAPGAARVTSPVEVSADRPAAVHLSIDVGIVARGRVPPGALPSFREARLVFESDDGGGSANGSLATDGGYSIPGLVEGRSYRRWIHIAGPSEPAQLFVAAGPAATAEALASGDSAEWLPAASLAVRFVEPKRLDPGAKLRIVDSTGAIVFEVSPVPRFGFDRVLSLGRYTIELDHPGHVRESIAVQLDASLTEPVYLLRSE